MVGKLLQRFKREGARPRRAEKAAVLVADLRGQHPADTLCYIVLVDDWPLTAQMRPTYSGTDDDEYLLCFLGRKKARAFINAYQELYAPAEALSLLALADVAQLWALLHAQGRGKAAPPYGLLVDFNYAGRPFSRYRSFALRSGQTLASKLDADAKYGAGPGGVGWLVDRPRGRDEAAMHRPPGGQVEEAAHLSIGGRALVDRDA